VESASANSKGTCIPTLYAMVGIVAYLFLCGKVCAPEVLK